MEDSVKFMELMNALDFNIMDKANNLVAATLINFQEVVS